MLLLLLSSATATVSVYFSTCLDAVRNNLLTLILCCLLSKLLFSVLISDRMSQSAHQKILRKRNCLVYLQGSVSCFLSSYRASFFSKCSTVLSFTSQLSTTWQQYEEVLCFYSTHCCCCCLAEGEAMELLWQLRAQRRQASPKLPETVTRLAAPDGSILYLVGTAHFSDSSKNDVAMVS